MNQIARSVPPYDIHRAFVRYCEGALDDSRVRGAFGRLAAKARIRSRWSFLAPAATGAFSEMDAEGFYAKGRFPSTAKRMERYEREAPALAERTIRKLNLDAERGISHLVLTSCTGFYAPGLDIDILARCGLNLSAERTLIGFMGCSAAMNALKFARHVVRSEPSARVLVVSLELCTLHFQESASLDQLLAFLQFGDGCAAALVSADPRGMELINFETMLFPDGHDDISWRIRDTGFDMFLSANTPRRIGDAVRRSSPKLFQKVGRSEVAMWAVHPGGRAILDAVEAGLELGPHDLTASRSVLENFGNMSSATILFVLHGFLEHRPRLGALGCAMAFGPGLTAETMTFRQAEAAPPCP